MTGYYDVVLGLIPLGLGTIATALTLLGYQLTVAVPVASLFAIGLICHAMFVRTPTDAAPETERTGGPAPTAD
jgi:Sec-independent protein secretion pathway component TatC